MGMSWIQIKRYISLQDRLNAPTSYWTGPESPPKCLCKNLIFELKYLTTNYPDIFGQLFGLGVSNVLGSFFSAYPTTGKYSIGL